MLSCHDLWRSGGGLYNWVINVSNNICLKNFLIRESNCIKQAWVARTEKECKAKVLEKNCAIFILWWCLKNEFLQCAQINRVDMQKECVFYNWFSLNPEGDVSLKITHTLSYSILEMLLDAYEATNFNIGYYERL